MSRSTAQARARIALFTLLACSASARAQQQLERVEITGSAIKRIDAETAVPVTVLQAEDLKKEGITTVEEILGRIAASRQASGHRRCSS